MTTATVNRRRSTVTAYVCMYDVGLLREYDRRELLDEEIGKMSLQDTPFAQ
ncbi:MAG: hypothetical protein ACUVWS_16955 [Roseiflexus sp.]